MVMTRRNSECFCFDRLLIETLAVGTLKIAKDDNFYFGILRPGLGVIGIDLRQCQEFSRLNPDLCRVNEIAVSLFLEDILRLSKDVCLGDTAVEDECRQALDFHLIN